MEWVRTAAHWRRRLFPLARGLLEMVRYWVLLMGLLASAWFSSGGCRSCSSCHDYDPPVANCECNACGCHRTGSASGGYASEAYSTEEYTVEGSMEDSATEEPVSPIYSE